MWRKFTVYGLRFSKTSFWNRMNTGFIDPAVATVLTACGIETLIVKFTRIFNACCNSAYRLRYWNTIELVPFVVTLKLQQCLPLAVLKLYRFLHFCKHVLIGCNSAYRLRYWNANKIWTSKVYKRVATVLTACGIETPRALATISATYGLQQCLPLAVLKLPATTIFSLTSTLGCNSAYRLRYWNCIMLIIN